MRAYMMKASQEVKFTSGELQFGAQKAHGDMVHKIHDWLETICKLSLPW